MFFFCCCFRIIDENNGKAPLTYVRFQTVLKSIGPPKRPVPAPTQENMEGTSLQYIKHGVIVKLQAVIL